MIKSKAIPVRENLNKAEFTQQYLSHLTPVVLKNYGKDWPATRKWDLDYFKDQIGDNIVPVYNSRPAEGKEHQHQAAQELPMREYLSMLEAGESDLRIFFYSILKYAPQLLNDFSYPDIGLKFTKRLPVLFMGGKGARVQMHYDIDLSNLILYHFGGPKKVLLVAPEYTPFMYHVPFSFSALFDVDFDNPDYDKYPALQNVTGMTCELEHGDALYIPSGYWHYINYLDIGYSLTLRAFPRIWSNRARMMKNIFYTRSIEGVMRKLSGQNWVERNERRAVEIANNNYHQTVDRTEP